MRLSRPATFRLLVLVAIGVVFALAWRHFRTVPLLPLAITYRSADSFGLRDNHQLEALRDGRVDIVSLRFL